MAEPPILPPGCPHGSEGPSAEAQAIGVVLEPLDETVGSSVDNTDI
jgi:hypothetical protein